MGYHIQVRYQGRVQDDESVRGVKQLDGVRVVWSSVVSTLDWEIHKETLKVYNHAKDKDGSSKVHQVGQILTVESFPQGSEFVLFCGQKIE